MMWPEHCIQGSDGAAFVLGGPNEGEHNQQKGMKEKYDSYSAFEDDGEMDTGLAQILRDKGVDTV